MTITMPVRCSTCHQPYDLGELTECLTCGATFCYRCDCPCPVQDEDQEVAELAIG